MNAAQNKYLALNCAKGAAHELEHSVRFPDQTGSRCNYQNQPVELTKKGFKLQRTEMKTSQEGIAL